MASVQCRIETAYLMRGMTKIRAKTFILLYVFSLRDKSLGLCRRLVKSTHSSIQEIVSVHDLSATYTFLGKVYKYFSLFTVPMIAVYHSLTAITHSRRLFTGTATMNGSRSFASTNEQRHCECQCSD